MAGIVGLKMVGMFGVKIVKANIICLKIELNNTTDIFAKIVISIDSPRHLKMVNCLFHIFPASI